MAHLERALIFLALGAAGSAAAGPLAITDAWIRATPPGARTAAAYLTIANTGAADRLLGGATAAARAVEIHTHVDERGLQRMVRLAELSVPAGETVRLTPGGLHLMLVEVAAPLAAGASVTLSLRFAAAGTLEIEVPVVDARASFAHDPPCALGAGDVTARRLALVAAALTATALGVATWVYLDAGADRALDVNGYVLAQPRALPAVELIDEHAAPFLSADFAGHWSFLYFGYTYCPDVCPLTLVTLASLKGQLAAELPATRIEYYLVSVDPQRDTPERLRAYVAYFDSTFRGLSGSPSALAALGQATETLFDVPEDQGADNYLVSHSSNVVLLDPDGHVYAVFTPPHDPARLAADFTKVAARYAAAR